MKETEVLEEQTSPVRVVRALLPRAGLSEQLLGEDTVLSHCEIVFRTMLPSPPEATLQAVTPHGIVLQTAPESAGGEEAPTGLVVPWDQVAYIRYGKP
jgi:hypothetical protein